MWIALEIWSRISRPTSSQRLLAKGWRRSGWGGQEVAGPYESYEEACEGELFAIFGSTGLLEISKKRNSAHKTQSLGRGTTVRVTRSPQGETKP